MIVNLVSYFLEEGLSIMGVQAKNFKTAVSSTLILSLLTLAGCNKPADAPQQNSAPASTIAQAAPYTPPTAEQLSQMVAPIALFPDKLVGQVLAGATYPEQIVAANQWLAQNPSLKGDALQAAAASRPWDVSVKSLTTFPSVLNQMAGNVQWTKELGEAYVNDPSDVMNAIQALRLRAQQAGNLKTSPHLRVSATARASAPPPAQITQSPSEPMVYSGPAVIPPPPQTIVIEPAERDVVYVPHYNPAVVYGEPVRVYPGWVSQQPAYTSENVVTTGVISFGVGVLVGAAISHHDWGWNSWGVNWGAPSPSYDGGWHRPAVVYNNSTYVSKSVTVVNHVNNINNINVTNNNYRTTNNVVNRTQNVAINSASQQPSGVMSMPHFTSHDAVPGPHPSPAAPAMHAAVAPHSAPTPPMVQHDQHQQPHVAQEIPAAKMAPPAAKEPAHEESRIDRVPAQAMADRAHPDTTRMPPVQHADAGMPHHAPPPPREINSPDRPQAHVAHQDMLAMHNEHPHVATQPAAAKHPAEKHDEKNHHDKHDVQEHHG
jgi:hypothetical protein